MQCLDYALDQLHADGGYILAGRSIHWPIAHVMHSHTAPGGLTHYAPPDQLRQPWHAIFGFAGEVRQGDTDSRRPMSRRAIVLSFALAFALSIRWAARSWLRELRHDA